jgi:hypothetical protein
LVAGPTPSVSEGRDADDWFPQQRFAGCLRRAVSSGLRIMRHGDRTGWLGSGHTAKTRHQKRPAETGGRNGASIAKFRTRRPAHIRETSQYRAVFERPTARTMLIAAAAQRWRVSAASCRAERGKVVHVPTGRS